MHIMHIGHNYIQILDNHVAINHIYIFVEIMQRFINQSILPIFHAFHDCNQEGNECNINLVQYNIDDESDIFMYMNKTTHQQSHYIFKLEYMIPTY